MELGISLHRLIYVRFVLFQRSHIIICAQTAANKRVNDEKLADKKDQQWFNDSAEEKKWKDCICLKKAAFKSQYVECFHCSAPAKHIRVQCSFFHLMAFFTSLLLFSHSFLCFELKSKVYTIGKVHIQKINTTTKFDWIYIMSGAKR